MLFLWLWTSEKLKQRTLEMNNALELEDEAEKAAMFRRDVSMFLKIHPQIHVHEIFPGRLLYYLIFSEHGEKEGDAKDRGVTGGEAAFDRMLQLQGSIRIVLGVGHRNGYECE